MPRNPAIPLSASDRLATIGLVKSISEHGGPIRVTYGKRDGTKGTAQGTVDSFPGKAGFDTHSVNIVTEDRGIRTINLVRVNTLVLL